MATYTLISSNVLASSAASVTFSSIPATYTDLVLKASIRNNRAFVMGGSRVRFNNLSTSIYSYTLVDGDGSSATSSQSSATTEFEFVSNGNSSTADTFGSLELYLPNYTGSAKKCFSTFAVSENNATNANIRAEADLMDITSAINQITFLLPGASTYSVGSSFYLYGISNA
jgi:hypothetical protein